MEKLGKKKENIRLYNDIHSSIHLASNSSFHFKTKHIHLKYHFMRSVMEDELLKLENKNISPNPVDMLTKVVTIEKISYSSISIGLQA